MFKENNALPRGCMHMLWQKAIYAIILLLITACAVFGQPNVKPIYPNAISIAITPEDKGIGLRYDRFFSNNYIGIGIYNTTTYGNYKLPNEGHIYNHVRNVIGISMRMFGNSYDHTCINFGTVYHYYGYADYVKGTLNEDVFFPLSLEIGVQGVIKRVNFGFGIDLLKSDGYVVIGTLF
jgi:hypothetical protein